MCVAWYQRSPVYPTPSPWWSRPSPWVQSPASTSSVAAVGPSAMSSLERQRSSPPHRSTRGWGRAGYWHSKQDLSGQTKTKDKQLNEHIMWNHRELLKRSKSITPQHFFWDFTAVFEMCNSSNRKPAFMQCTLSSQRFGYTCFFFLILYSLFFSLQLISSIAVPFIMSFSFLLNLHVSPFCYLCMPREHRVQEGKVVFPLGVSVQGDVVVSVYHMRSTIGGRLQAKVHFIYSSMMKPTESV